MNWKDVRNELPSPDERVLVWIKYEGAVDFTWTDSELDNPDSNGYIEPNSQRNWMMGSAENYIITHFARIYPPEES